MALISVTEYANKYGKDPGNIRRMLLCGRLAGYKIGKQWVLDEDEKYPEDNRVKNGKYKVYSHEELNRIIVPILKKYNAKNATLFGSYARNEATIDSDIDLLVDGGRNFEPTDVLCIAEDICEASGKNVDVYEKREIANNSKLYKNIKRDGVVIS